MVWWKPRRQVKPQMRLFTLNASPLEPEDELCRADELEALNFRILVSPSAQAQACKHQTWNMHACSDYLL